jgi:hypothetical protein
MHPLIQQELVRERIATLRGSSLHPAPMRRIERGSGQSVREWAGALLVRLGVRLAGGPDVAGLARSAG